MGVRAHRTRRRAHYCGKVMGELVMAQTVDGVLLQHGQLLFYPEPRHGRPASAPRLPKSSQAGARVIRRHIEAVVYRVPQVMVKITGTSKGMKQLMGHLTYITKHGKLPLTDDQGEPHVGMTGVDELADDFRYGGSLIPESGDRREAYHISLGMPAGTDVNAMISAAEEFIANEFGNHLYAWVVHEHQRNPHVHLVVRAEGRNFKRLPTRKPDLHRWREDFARALRNHGIEADATKRVARGVVRDAELLWQVKAYEDGRLDKSHKVHGKVAIKPPTMYQVLEAWGHIHNALQASADPADQQLANDLRRFLAGTPMARIVHGIEKAREWSKQPPMRQPNGPGQGIG
jgi:hypothetical protein